MSSEIRASSALLSSGVQSGTSDLSIQNPLFSIGDQDAFNRVLNQQVTARQDSRQTATVRQDARDHHADKVRREPKANHRQDGGKALPERAESHQAASRTQSSSANPPKKTDQSAEETTGDAVSVTAAQVADQSGASATETNQATESQQAEGADAVVVSTELTSAALSSAADLSGAAAGELDIEADGASVLEELALMQASEIDGEESAVIDSEAGTLPSDMDSQALPSEAADNMLEAQQASADVQALSNEVAQSNLDSIEQSDADAVIATDASLEAAAMLAQQAAESTASSATLTGNGSRPNASQATSPGADVSVPSSIAAEVKSAVSDLVGQGDQQDAANGDASGDLEHWELGHEPSQAEKNAENRAEFSKVLSASGERGSQMKEQLAALAQQLNGSAAQQDKPETRKVDSVSDIKPTAFGRSLEQLSSSRTEGGKPVSTGIQTPVGNREWAGELGQRLVMMVSSKLKSAEIHLNPKDLGPVEVRIRMHEDKAHVVFTSQVAQTREALEQAVPRLREMLDQNGVALGNVDVQDHGAHQSHQQSQSGEGGQGRDGAGSSSSDIADDSDKVPTRVLGLVDYYA